MNIFCSKNLLLFLLLCTPHQANALSLDEIWQSIKQVYKELIVGKSNYREMKKITIEEEDKCALCREQLYTLGSSLRLAPITYDCSHSLHFECARKQLNHEKREASRRRRETHLACSLCKHEINKHQQTNIDNISKAHEWYESSRARNLSDNETKAHRLLTFRGTQVKILQRECQALRSQHTDLIQENTSLFQENTSLFNNQEKLYNENRLLKNILLGGAISLTVVSTAALAIGWRSKR